MTITDSTRAEVAAVFHRSPIPVGLLAAGMAVLVYGEWCHITSAYWDQDGGRYRVLFAPGTGVPGASFTPEETVWAYPDWQRLADLASAVPECAGHDRGEDDVSGGGDGR